MKYIITFLILILSTTAYSHEMVPAYPKLVPSFMDGIYKTDLTLFNKREDSEYYEIEVFDKDWNSLPFASESRLLQVGYLKKKKFEVYIRKKDIKTVTYICTMSKLGKDNEATTIIASRICSKIK